MYVVQTHYEGMGREKERKREEEESEREGVKRQNKLKMYSVAVIWNFLTNKLVFYLFLFCLWFFFFF